MNIEMDSLNIKRIDLNFFIGFLLLTLIMGLFISSSHPQYTLMRFISESFGNIGGVIVASFFFNCFLDKVSFLNRIIIAVTTGLGLIIYEFLQKWIPWQTFDVYDILGTLVGIIITIFLNGLVLIFLMFKKNGNSK